MQNRLAKLSAIAATIATSFVAAPLAAQAENYEVPPLPYPYEALNPVIDTETMHLHHDKHHLAYVTKLNGAVQSAPELNSLSLVEIVENVGTSKVPSSVAGVVRNNGGGHWNHSFFWTIMRPSEQKSEMSSELKQAINKSFGSLEKLQETFNNAGANQFGSGWAWLIVKEDGSLAVTSTPNQDNPLMKSVVGTPGIPILGNDVWEHAYYLKYKNNRPEYLKQWWNVVNWEQV